MDAPTRSLRKSEAWINSPAHGLYANSNPRRTGPYRSLAWCVDRYDDAAVYRLGQRASELRWGYKIHDPDVMGLITMEEVIQQAEKLIAELDEKTADPTNPPFCACW